MKKFCADFETTTDPQDCRVWAYGICEIGNTNKFIYGNNMDDFMEWCRHSDNSTLYFHNLKFDGDFIINWLFDADYLHVNDRKLLHDKSFTTLISDKGMFYSIEVCFNVRGRKKDKVVFLDSLKILNFSVPQISKMFDLPISKLEIDYKEYRKIDHILTDIELDYLRNDVEIVARALEILFKENLTQMTQGSNAIYNYKEIIGKKNFEKWFPPPDYDSDIRNSYKGGFTYLNPKYASVDIGKGIVLDVNSLYPSVMYYERMPYGEGKWFHGRYEKDKQYNLYVQMFTCNFELKPNHIPTIQIKGSGMFVGTEYLTSSNGEDVTLCLTSVDLKLFFDHYEISNITWHSGWKFQSTYGMFKDYIDKWVKIKIDSELNGNKGMRTLAKLMLNALYGKFALNPKVQGKYPVLVNGLVKYKLGEEETRTPIYIPIGTFITSYARNKTIRSAQEVYSRFVYADTDSLHLIGKEVPEGLDIHPTELGKWKLENEFTRARFIRQKTYAEEINGKMEITCAGMPKNCYQYVNWDNFKIGSQFAGKLAPKHVKGGIVLLDTMFTIKR